MIRRNKSINKLMVKTVFEGNILIPLPKLLVEKRFHSLFSIISPTHCDYKYEVKKLLFLGSSCIYPKLAPQPLKEEYLLTGFLEETNEAYAIAKIAGIRLCKHYNQQYETNFISVMHTNLYGPNDSFYLETSHVMPALVRKFREAKVNNKPEVVVWVTGKPLREFMNVDNMTEACVF